MVPSGHMEFVESRTVPPGACLGGQLSASRGGGASYGRRRGQGFAQLNVLNLKQCICSNKHRTSKGEK